jgi:hypothetical protein
MIKESIYTIDVPKVNDIMFELCDDYEYELYTTEYCDEYSNYYWYHVKDTSPSGDRRYITITTSMVNKILRANKKLEKMGYKLFARFYQEAVVCPSLQDCETLPCGIKNFYYIKDVVDAGYLHRYITDGIETDIELMAVIFKKEDIRYHQFSELDELCSL